MLTATRTHPAVFTTMVVLSVPVALISASPGVVVDLALLVAAHRYLIHSRINSDFGWIGRYLLQSPVHHRLHHILSLAAPIGHYSLFPPWDHLFGTWRGPADHSLAIGVTTPYRHGAWLGPDLWRDYCDFWQGLFRRNRQAPSRQLPATNGPSATLPAPPGRSST